jgi:regulatory protein
LNYTKAEAWRPGLLYLYKSGIDMVSLKTITAISAVRHPGSGRSNIFLEGMLAFSLADEIVAEKSLKVGQALSQQDIVTLNEADASHNCLNAALHFLSYRPRSESEIKLRLKHQGYTAENINGVIDHLKSLNLVNDIAFAEYWKVNRNTFRPRSQGLVKMELRRKGLNTETIDQVVQDVDDVENAYRIAVIKAQKLSLADFQVFRQKLGSYLQRRGYSYGVINKTIKQVWQERTQELKSEFDLIDF